MAELPPVLDACCGPRMMWFDRTDSRALFIDNRRAEYAIDMGTPGTIGRSPIVIDPDELADFTALPFPDASFHLVVFDPPHIERNEPLGFLTQKYGILKGDWREMIRGGFAECFRVLKPHGTLVFKWTELKHPVQEILKLTPERPLFGHKSSKTTRWCVFMKGPTLGESAVRECDHGVSLSLPCEQCRHPVETLAVDPERVEIPRCRCGGFPRPTLMGRMICSACGNDL